VAVVKAGVVKLAPVPTCVPPQLPVNHFVVALPPVAVKVVVAPEHIVVVPVIAVGAIAAAVRETVVDAQADSVPHTSFAA
jgi:hypothetical protein